MADADLIISGLRGPCDDCDGNEHNTCLRCQLEFDAADEIERLREENAKLRSELSRLTEIGIENLERIDRWREAYINLREKTRKRQADIHILRFSLLKSYLKTCALIEDK